MRKVLYIFSLIISLLLNASADVYKLRVKGELAGNDEFWVKDGAPIENQTTDSMHFVSTTKTAEETPSANSNKIYFKKKKTGTNDDNREVVVYLKGIENQDDRRVVAKQQFENILKCGLLSKNIIKCDNNGYAFAQSTSTLKKTISFNSKIFENKFLLTPNGDSVLVRGKYTQGLTSRTATEEQKTCLQNALGALKDKWQMPGIAVRVSHDSKDEFPVMYAMKISRPSQCDVTYFFQEADWKKLLQGQQPRKTFGNYEHTERQLFYSMICGNTELQELELVAPLTIPSLPTPTKMMKNDTFLYGRTVIRV